MATKSKSFGEQLRKNRLEKKWTAERLAKNCKVSRSYITLIENGRRLPGKKQILAIAHALEIKSGTVLNWYLEDINARIKKELGLSS